MLLVILSLSILISSVFVVILVNPVHSILCLVLTFLLINFIFFCLNLEFLALIMIIVYIGAVMILFLFVIMMLNIKIIEVNSFNIKRKNQTLFGIFLIIIFVIQFVILNLKIYFINLSSTKNDYDFSTLQLFDYFSKINNVNEFQNLSYLFYQEYPIILLLCSIVLLLAMILSIVLTLKNKKNIYSQKIYVQLIRDFNRTTRLLKK